MFCTSKNLYKYFHWPFWRGNNIFFAVSPEGLKFAAAYWIWVASAGKKLLSVEGMHNFGSILSFTGGKVINTQETNHTISGMVNNTRDTIITPLEGYGN